MRSSPARPPTRYREPRASRSADVPSCPGKAPRAPRLPGSALTRPILVRAGKAQITPGVCAFSMALVVTQRAVDRRPHVIDPALTALWPQDRSSGLHAPALPDMDFRNRASSNFWSNFVSESESTGFVEDLVRLQAEAAGDDFLLDLGGAAEDRLDSAVGSDVIRPSSHNRRLRSCGRADPSTRRLASRDRRRVHEPGSRHFTPCVSLDPAAVGQGGRGGQRQHGVYLRGGEHLAGQRPIADQQFFRTPVVIRASSHSALPHGLGRSMSGIGASGSVKDHTSRHRGNRPLPYSTTLCTEPPPSRFSVPQAPQSPRSRSGAKSPLGDIPSSPSALAIRAPISFYATKSRSPNVGILVLVFDKVVLDLPPVADAHYLQQQQSPLAAVSGTAR
jgi:hypothetical protein